MYYLILSFHLNIYSLCIEGLLFCIYVIYLSDYFTNLLKVNPGLCIHVFVIIGRCVSQTVCIFCLQLSRADLTGVDRQGGFRTIGITPIGFIVFYKVLNPTPWTLREILGVRSTLEGFCLICVCLKFLRKIQSYLRKCWRFLWNFLEGLFQSRAYLGGLLYFCRVAVFIWKWLQHYFYLHPMGVCCCYFKVIGLGFFLPRNPL